MSNDTGWAGPLLLTLAGAMRRGLLTLLELLAVPIVAFYEWGWRPLADLLASLARYRWFARIEAWIAALPPYGALALFATPAVVLFPVKLFALYLLASGRPIIAVGLIVLAKIVGTAFVARVFMLTQPQLMQIAWFKRAFDWFMPWKKHVFEIVKSSLAWRSARAGFRRLQYAAGRVWRSETTKRLRSWVKMRIVYPTAARFMAALSWIAAAMHRRAL
ncbi:MAG: hypothetical protein K2Y05_03980 [Hyphomicrobiaceae bacterium]|nr:hypothetical protein [Hyphomicrobiaceae bacterium]